MMRVSEAVELLAETDEDYGRQKGYCSYLEYKLKTIEAEMYLSAKGTQDERKSHARSSDAYIGAALRSDG